MVAVRKDYAAPTELENLVIPISTNMPRPTALGSAAFRPLQLSEKSGAGNFQYFFRLNGEAA